MDRFLALSATLVLFLCGLLLLEDLRVIHLGWLTKTNSKNYERIGKVVTFHNDVKRRSRDDFLWTKTRKNEDLFFHDTVLTLQNSQASLELNGNSLLELSENTLVVIEPPDKLNVSEIRLRFKSGFVASKNMDPNTKMSAGDYTIKVDKGTEFYLRTTENESFEMEVKKGSAEIAKKTENGEEKTLVKENESIEMSQTNIEKSNTLQDLKWKTETSLRVYTRGPAVKVPLKWTGQAKWIKHETKNEKTQVALSAEQQKRSVASDGTSDDFVGDVTGEIELEGGRHHLRLENDYGKSEMMTVEVIETKPIHLYFPLPRDRMDIQKSATFSWGTLNEFRIYELEVSPDPDFFKVEYVTRSEWGFVEFKPTHPGRYYWRVRGVDDKGFASPPSYSNEIIFVNDPLEAPGSSEGADFKGLLQEFGEKLSRLFFSRANAADTVPEKSPHQALQKTTLVFAWKPVKDADKYTLEVDDDPYFQSPEVIISTETNEYKWQNPIRGMLYWRVAGDKSNGRLGLFSAVQKLQINHVGFAKVRKKDFDVYWLDTTPEVTAALPEAMPVEKEAETLQTPLEDTRGYSGRVWFGVGYGLHTLKTKEIDKIQLKGIETFRVGFDGVTQVSGSFIKAKVEAGGSTWNVSNKKKYPYQKSQSFIDTNASLSFSNSRTHWLGASYVRLPHAKRTDYESFDLVAKTAFGPHYIFDARIADRIHNSFEASFLLGGTATGWQLGDQVTWTQLISHKLNSQINFGARYQSLTYKGDGSTQMLRLHLGLGLEW